jgi:hypothetical protein
VGATACRGFRQGAALGLSALLASLVAAPSPSPASPASALAGTAHSNSDGTTATISLGRPSTKLPTSYFGLSMEYNELPIYERFPSAFARILGLLKAAQDGPQVVRIGGDSADLTFWNPGSTHLPAGAYVLTQDWFTQFSQLIADAGLRVLLDLNLKTGSAAQARELVQQARSQFPAGSLIGLEIGNEPDQYGHGYSTTSYVRAFKAYAQALHPVAPGVPLLGPAPTSTQNNFTWLQAVISGDRSRLGVLSGHQYPLAACESPGDPGYPTIGKLLGSGLTSGLAASVKPAVELAHRAGRPFRLDETNSVTCHGKPGVSDTFATALWAPDALFSLLRTGLDAVNVHIRPTTVNGPLVVDSAGFSARPLFYGLMLFARTVSPDGRLLQVTRHGPPTAHLSVWAVRVKGGAIHVLLINKGGSSVTVKLQLPHHGTLTVERLLAASVTATSGVTLGGQHLGSDGTMQGPMVGEGVAVSSGPTSISVPRYSAALASTAP